MYSIYAKTANGKIIKGTSNAESPAAALGEAHTAAQAQGMRIIKATVKELTNRSAFSVVDVRAKSDDAKTDAAAASTDAPDAPARRAGGTRGRR